MAVRELNPRPLVPEIKGHEPLCDQIRPRDLRLAWDTCLAQAAGGRRAFQPVFQPFLMQGFGADIVPTLIFIVTPLRNGAHRTPGDAFPTGFISKEEAILPEMTVFFLAWMQLQEGHDTPDSYGTPPGRDKSITQTERPEAARVGHVAFRPG